jgi:branched-chain amino acid transport system ATP-binding protein
VPLLELAGLGTGYGMRGGHSAPVLFDVSLTVGEAEIVALLGPNGAGKTTTLRTVAGLLPLWSGTVRYDGHDLAGLVPERVARLGVQLIPEGGGVLRDLTVFENLRLAGSATLQRRRGITGRLARAFELFPALAHRQAQRASTLSGGERQMLALAQAVMTDARLVLVDEASLGLAPLLVRRLFDILPAFRDEGRSVLVVEQNATQALDVADRAYVMEKGRIVDGGDAAHLVEERVADLYLGE